MLEKSEIEKRDRDERPTQSPGLEATRNARNPRQGGERRYERNLEADAPEMNDDESQPNDSNDKSSKPPAERVKAKNYVAYTIKLPSDQLAALQSIWLELKKLYGSHSPDKSGMIQAAIDAWLKRWDGPEHDKLLEELLDIRQSTRRRQYRKGKD
ncbi:MAG: hypothetical protein SGJ27_10065 [Candidatus Melainabacteria bacterium]|nr:hypothetical protein [Candidatus Melainabacteria bacterium]